ncbi:Serine phosphatase RsbU, regulator of sigma subunit [Neorhodopirellula lusitana]|uniref:Serine phosphatase RsbU, regulator of sigma subunit n=1 Tax=Neorhodopirellula lusitana TaxID=445327 RepID=A0ABY1PNN5_9BACT|nr:SpoIIE family protein phosphatase [Neorhodopirellula lusitana]SMP39061.1 Serine phosphatase RsbU, regulator of sigma subunit [Neorhodopirellula lusitana]
MAEPSPSLNSKSDPVCIANHNVLLVEDSETDAVIIKMNLSRDARFVVTHAKSLGQAFGVLGEAEITVIILDLNLPDSVGIETFDSIHARYPALPVVILSGEEDVELALQAVANEAQDYLPKKDVNPQLLTRSLLYAIERQARLLAERHNSIVESELQVARTIQQQMLPTQAPILAGYEIAAVCEPTKQCGGDFFDFLQLGEGILDFVVGDVSNHGFGSALIMVGARRALRTCARMHGDVGKILTVANQSIFEDTGGEHFVTLFYGRLNPVDHVLTYSAAGHPVWMISADGTIQALESHGLPLGLIEENQYNDTETIALHPGDLLLAPTDGAYEAMNEHGDHYGTDRMFEVVAKNRDKSTAEIRDALIADIRHFCQPLQPFDDVTVAILKVQD